MNRRPTISIGPVLVVKSAGEACHPSTTFGGKTRRKIIVIPKLAGVENTVIGLAVVKAVLKLGFPARSDLTIAEFVWSQNSATVIDTCLSDWLAIAIGGAD